MNFIRMLNRGNFYFLTRIFKFGGKLAAQKLVKHTKYQLSISKVIPARPKNH